MHENEISYATVKNWEKLNTNSEGRLENARIREDRKRELFRVSIWKIKRI